MKMLPAITRKEKGQSLVELALVFTLLLLLISGIIDLGRMYYTYTALQDTAQEGAIYASLHPADLTSIQTHIKQSASSPINASNITDNNIKVQCSGADCVPPVSSNLNSCQGKPIKVDVVYQYDLTMPFIGGQSVYLKASVTDTILQSPTPIASATQVCPP